MLLSSITDSILSFGAGDPSLLPTVTDSGSALDNEYANDISGERFSNSTALLISQEMTNANQVSNTIQNSFISKEILLRLLSNYISQTAFDKNSFSQAAPEPQVTSVIENKVKSAEEKPVVAKPATIGNQEVDSFEVDSSVKRVIQALTESETPLKGEKTMTENESGDAGTLEVTNQEKTLVVSQLNTILTDLEKARADFEVEKRKSLDLVVLAQENDNLEAGKVQAMFNEFHKQRMTDSFAVQTEQSSISNKQTHQNVLVYSMQQTDKILSKAAETANDSLRNTISHLR